MTKNDDWIDVTKCGRVTGEDILAATEGLYFVNLIGISRAVRITGDTHG